MFSRFVKNNDGDNGVEPNNKKILGLADMLKKHLNNKVQDYVNLKYRSEKKENIYYETTATLKGFDETPKYGKKREVPKKKEDIHSESSVVETSDDNNIRYSLISTRHSFAPITSSEKLIRLRDEFDNNNKLDDIFDMARTEHTKLRYDNIRTNMTFVELLLEFIKEKNMKDPDVYTAAQIDRRHFSKMVSNSKYAPTKDTCIALALALHLNLSQTNDFISRAGYALSHSNKRDIVIEYFIVNKKYNIMELNEILYDNGEKMLGKQMSI